jgi:hypothetical protein
MSSAKVIDIYPVFDLFEVGGERAFEEREGFMEDLDIELGDLKYSQSHNHKFQHKIRFVDCMEELKKTYKEPTGRMYEYKSAFGLRTHRLYEEFSVLNNSGGGSLSYYKNKKEWVNRPDEFVNKFIDDCRKMNEAYTPNLPDNLLEFIIKTFAEWEVVRFADNNGVKKWRLQDIFEVFKKASIYKDEIYTTKSTLTTSIDNVMCVSANPNNIPTPDRRDLHNRGICVLKKLHTIFTDFVRPNNKSPYTSLYTLKVRRTYEGRQFNYGANYINKYHMTYWKKTLANGNCSNKDLKATHMYYYADGYKEKASWCFGGVKVDMAIDCLKQNGYVFDKKKKISYRDMKMWWYKLE